MTYRRHRKNEDNQKQRREGAYHQMQNGWRCSEQGCLFTGPSKAGLMNHIRQKHTVEQQYQYCCLSAHIVEGLLTRRHYTCIGDSVRTIQPEKQQTFNIESGGTCSLYRLMWKVNAEEEEAKSKSHLLVVPVRTNKLGEYDWYWGLPRSLQYLFQAIIPICCTQAVP